MAFALACGRARGASSLAIRSFSTQAARPSGRLHICGTGESYKLGTGDTRDIETPTALEGLDNIVHVSCGRYHTAALSAEGDVYAWGLESSGQLGLGSKRTKAPTPTKVDGLSGIGVSALSCGLYHTLALTEEGDVFSFGFGGTFLNGVGGLGHGDRTQLEAPAKIDGFKATGVSAGGYHSVAVDANGSAYSWGRGEWGRLGHEDSSDCYEPTRLESPELEGGVSTIFAGEVHTGALTPSGAVYTWGRNENWQLGYEVTGLLNAGQSLDAQQEPQIVELPVSADEMVVSKLSCGELGTAALMSDGKTVYVWGMGRFFEPTALPGTHKIDGQIVDVSVGGYHMALLTDSGRMYSFGTGPSLGLPRSARQQWELIEVTAHSLEGKRVLDMCCGPYSTAMIVEA